MEEITVPSDHEIVQPVVDYGKQLVQANIEDDGLIVLKSLTLDKENGLTVEYTVVEEEGL